MKTCGHIRTLPILALAALLLIAPGARAAGANRQTVATTSCSALFEDGTLVGLSGADGRVFAAFDGALDAFACLHRLDDIVTAGSFQTRTVDTEPAGWSWRAAGFP